MTKFSRKKEEAVMLSELNLTILDIAKKAILEKLTGEKLVNKEELVNKFPELSDPGAVFVTLNKNGQLRGCIGSIEAHRSLIDDIIYNAQAAAFKDTRFTPVDLDEMAEISIEVSLLSKPEPVEYDSIEDLEQKIEPFKDGIILIKGLNRAVFLPQVWEQLPDFYQFFEYLCRKAHLPEDCLWSYPAIYRFRVKIIEE
jgi:AmmeMemoRadiSam system protein A